MPGFDRTGPRGAGAGTGWGRGRCTTGGGVAQPRWGGAFGGAGRGGMPWGGAMGRCFGGGARWWSRFFGPREPISATEEADVLRAQLAAAREDIAAMEARLTELEKDRSQ